MDFETFHSELAKLAMLKSTSSLDGKPAQPYDASYGDTMPEHFYFQSNTCKSVKSYFDVVSWIVTNLRLFLFKQVE
jgi:hypothetical protein